MKRKGLGIGCIQESASTTDESGEGSLSNSSSPGVQMMGSQNLKAGTGRMRIKVFQGDRFWSIPIHGFPVILLIFAPSGKAKVLSPSRGYAGVSLR